jgi:hypothetical protein
MAIFEGLIGSIKHLCSHSSIKIRYRSFEVTVFNVQIKVVLEISPCVVVNFEELLRFPCEFLRHIWEIGEFFKIVGSETHISFKFTLVYALGQYISRLPLDVLIEFHCYQIISANELPEVRYFDG